MKAFYILLIGSIFLVGCEPDKAANNAETPAPLPPEAVRALEESAAMAQMTPEQMADSANTKRIAREYFDKSLAIAKSKDKKLFVHFGADW